MAYELVNINLYYSSLHVLDNISFTLKKETITAIMGPSGCGKTSLLNIIAGLLPPSLGKVVGMDRATFSYSFQESRLIPWLTVKQNLLFTLCSKQETKVDATHRIDQMLSCVLLSEVADKKPHELSGGMRQRVSLLRAFLYPAEILLLDEAFKAVDLKTKLEVMDCFLTLWELKKFTVLIITHDIEEAVYLADRVIVLSNKPSTIIGDITIDLPPGDRCFSSASTLQYTSEIYRLILSTSSSTIS